MKSKIFRSILFASTGMKALSRLTLVRYILVGIINTFVGLGIIYLLKGLMDFDDISANACGYILGFIFSFFLNKNWTFQFQGAGYRTFVKFASVVLMAYAVNLAIVIFTVDRWKISGYLAQALGILPYTAINYLGSKHWVFRANARSQDRSLGGKS